ncbi:hypothetical protein [Beggiatoa leptomitoformis]|uniref:Uncharacterized protein n=1 Tax=Beggiatoa leptomitoformis TaxID=288004 RepID=A0A2N9YCT3_9GAMM|nr:hypothetical protein [Beggiatoa leptomitoformis]ALG66458.1 hypothetical protein AL038_00280 [Beggiatoa leptomitoformis]AUI68260.1 hypothetical protein BLE401_05790 [Beggiatoa leptomitoformis]
MSLLFLIFLLVFVSTAVAAYPTHLLAVRFMAKQTRLRWCILALLSTWLLLLIVWLISLVSGQIAYPLLFIVFALASIIFSRLLGTHLSQGAMILGGGLGVSVFFMLLLIWSFDLGTRLYPLSAQELVARFNVLRQVEMATNEICQCGIDARCLTDKADAFTQLQQQADTFSFKTAELNRLQRAVNQADACSAIVRQTEEAQTLAMQAKTPQHSSHLIDVKTNSLSHQATISNEETTATPTFKPVTDLQDIRRFIKKQVYIIKINGDIQEGYLVGMTSQEIIIQQKMTPSAFAIHVPLSDIFELQALY